MRHPIRRAEHQIKSGIATLFIGLLVALIPFALLYQLILWISHLF